MGDVHLDLLVSFDAGALDGQVRHDDGSVRPFQGWLGLMDVLEGLRPGPSATDRGSDNDMGGGI